MMLTVMARFVAAAFFTRFSWPGPRPVEVDREGQRDVGAAGALHLPQRVDHLVDLHVVLDVDVEQVRARGVEDLRVGGREVGGGCAGVLKVGAFRAAGGDRDRPARGAERVDRALERVHRLGAAPGGVAGAVLGQHEREHDVLQPGLLGQRGQVGERHRRVQVRPERGSGRLVRRGPAVGAGVGAAAPGTVAEQAVGPSRASPARQVTSFNGHLRWRRGADGSGAGVPERRGRHRRRSVAVGPRHPAATPPNEVPTGTERHSSPRSPEEVTAPLPAARRARCARARPPPPGPPPARPTARW